LRQLPWNNTSICAGEGVCTHHNGADKKATLLTHRRLQQSGFRPGRFAVDRILNSSILAQTRRKFQQSFYAAYKDFKAAFDSVNRQTIWLLLTKQGIPPKVINLVKLLYTNSVACVQVGGSSSDWFTIRTGLQQGCVLAPDHFLCALDFVMDRTVSQSLARATMGNKSFNNLDYADNATILTKLLSVLLFSLEILSLDALRVGLEVNCVKTKIQSFEYVPSHPPSFMIGAHAVDLVTNFTYLGVTIKANLVGVRARFVGASK